MNTTVLQYLLHVLSNLDVLSNLSEILGRVAVTDGLHVWIIDDRKK